MPSALLLAGVDRAAFVAGLSDRLRRAGIPVALPSMVSFTAALEVSFPRDVEELYWLARLTMVQQPHDLAVFDAVFDLVFRDTVLATDPPARRAAASPRARQGDALAPVAARPSGEESGDSLPWHTLPRSTPSADQHEAELALPELRPSDVARFADTPLEELDEREAAALGAWLEQSVRRWATRRSRRLEVHSRGTRVALRPTVAASRRTGWETVVLRRTRAVRRPRPVTVLADLSQSMQPYVPGYLALMRALARAGRAETFAFSTDLTRLTPALAQRSAAGASAAAGALATDRYGGTHLAAALEELLGSRHGQHLRGGILVVVSDGWDADAPERLARAMGRVSRRAHRVVWLNPRAAAPGFAPLVGSMAAALPYCDVFLPAHTPRAMREGLIEIAGLSSTG